MGNIQYGRKLINFNHSVSVLQFQPTLAEQSIETQVISTLPDTIQELAFGCDLENKSALEKVFAKTSLKCVFRSDRLSKM
jgi:hypothetical protein